MKVAVRPKGPGASGCGAGKMSAGGEMSRERLGGWGGPDRVMGAGAGQAGSAAWDSKFQTAVKPLSTRSSVPLTKELSSLAR